MINFNIDSNAFESMRHQESIKRKSFSGSLSNNDRITIEYKKTNRKESNISVISIDPLQKKQGTYVLFFKRDIIFNIDQQLLFQTQVQSLPVIVQPTKIIDEYIFDQENASRIKYSCPNCQLGELVIHFEHEGDCRNDFFFYDCCGPCMILCPSCCGGLPKYRICTLCKTEFDWKRS